MTQIPLQHVMSDPPTAKSLSQLISQVLQFQEDHLGKGVKSPPFARIPLRHFLNFLPDGPLCRDHDKLDSLSRPGNT